jgi:type II secretory pathway component GspD/PulD (secretin)
MSSTLRLAPSLLLAVIVAVGTASVARAGDAPAPEGDRISITFGDAGMKITDVLTATTMATGLPILWNDQDKAVTTGRVQGPRELKVPRGELFEAVRSLLVSQDVVLLPMGGDWGYWYAMDARMLQSRMVLRMKPKWILVEEKDLADLEARDGLFVSTLIQVENMDNLRDARTALQRLVTPNNIGNVQEVPSARSLLVTDFAPNVAGMWRAVKQMDLATRAPGLRIEAFRLAHAKAETVKALLTGLYPPRAVVQVPGQQAADMPLGGPYVMADEATNQVFVRASAPDLKAIAAVIQSLDVAPTPK